MNTRATKPSAVSLQLERRFSRPKSSALLITDTTAPDVPLQRDCGPPPTKVQRKKISLKQKNILLLSLTLLVMEYLPIGLSGMDGNWRWFFLKRKKMNSRTQKVTHEEIGYVSFHRWTIGALSRSMSASAPNFWVKLVQAPCARQRLALKLSFTISARRSAPKRGPVLASVGF